LLTITNYITLSMGKVAKSFAWDWESVTALNPVQLVINSHIDKRPNI